MRRWLYNLLMWLVWPLWLIYSYKRCRDQVSPYQCWRNLWTLNLPHFEQAPVWIHAVSLGETQAALILIRQLQRHYPHQAIFFTGGNRSATDLARKQAIPVMQVAFLPLDYACLRRRLLKAIRPKLLILMETEFWPNLLHTAHQQQVPIVIIQARLSQQSKRYYPQYGQPLLKQLLAPIQFVAAQTQADADALIQLGIESNRCHLLGNLKYDLSVPETLNNQAAQLKLRLGERWIWTAGSTHPEEEIPLLAAHQQLLISVPNALFILVPRHPSYFNKLSQKMTDMNIPFQRWSHWFDSQQPLLTTTQVLLVDTLGELMTAYQVAQACFVGGSLVPWGGHNLLEPAALSKPILAGPHNHNFAEIEQGLLSQQGLILTHDATSLAHQLIYWQQHPNESNTVGKSANHYFKSQQGTTQKILTHIAPYLN